MRLIEGFSRDFVREFIEDRVGGLAAEMAFYATLSLFPAMIALAATLGFLDQIATEQIAENAQTIIDDALKHALGEDATETTRVIANLFEERDSQGIVTGVVIALWAMSRGFGALTKAMDVAYDVRIPRNFFLARAIGLLMAVGTIIVATIAVVLYVVVPELVGESASSQGFVFHYGRPTLAFVILVLWAATLFHVAPNQHTPWKWDMPGAVFTALGWIVGGFGFGAYVEYASGDSGSVYGILGSAISLMVLLYVLSLVLILGGEINAILAHNYQMVVHADERAWLGARMRRWVHRRRSRRNRGSAPDLAGPAEIPAADTGETARAGETDPGEFELGAAGEVAGPADGTDADAAEGAAGRDAPLEEVARTGDGAGPDRGGGGR